MNKIMFRLEFKNNSNSKKYKVDTICNSSDYVNTK